ncbi:MAG: HAD hydrolase family protein [bacterium]|nr:HAD hydrolase family protein [bacterium]
MGSDLSKRLRQLKLIAFDFDGIFTDGKVIVDQHGNESVICSRKDTLRFPELRKHGVDLVVISKEKNPVVTKRCEKMKVDCLQGVDEKLIAFKQLLQARNLSIVEIAFMGDDINDMECLKFAGLAFTVADGHVECMAIADYVTSRKGGDHAVREVCDLILEAMEK